MFPIQRLRRLRMKKEVRDLVSETILSVKDFVYPLFIVTGKGVKKEINSMPGVFHFSVDKVNKKSAEKEVSENSNRDLFHRLSL